MHKVLIEIALRCSCFFALFCLSVNASDLTYGLISSSSQQALLAILGETNGAPHNDSRMNCSSLLSGKHFDLVVFRNAACDYGIDSNGVLREYIGKIAQVTNETLNSVSLRLPQKVAKLLAGDQTELVRAAVFSNTNENVTYIWDRVQNGVAFKNERIKIVQSASGAILYVVNTIDEKTSLPSMAHIKITDKEAIIAAEKEALRYLSNSKLFEGSVVSHDYKPEVLRDEIRLLYVDISDLSVRKLKQSSSALSQKLIVYSIPVKFNFVGDKSKFHIASLSIVEVCVDVVTGEVFLLY